MINLFRSISTIEWLKEDTKDLLEILDLHHSSGMNSLSSNTAVSGIYARLLNIMLSRHSEEVGKVSSSNATYLMAHRTNSAGDGYYYVKNNLSLVNRFGVTFVHANRGITELFETLDSDEEMKSKELKHLSIACVSGRMHKVRIYKQDNNYSVVYNLVQDLETTSIINKAFSLIVTDILARGQEFNIAPELVTFFTNMLNDKEDEARNALQAYVLRLEISKIRNQKAMQEFVYNLKASRIQNAQATLNSKNRNYTDAEARATRALAELQEARIRLAGIQATAVEDTELEDFITYAITHRYIKEVKPVSGSVLKLNVLVPLTHFDTAAWKRMRENPNSNANRRYNNETLLAFDRVFSQGYRIMMNQNIKVNTQDGGLEIHDAHPRDNQALPNPHLQRYHCWGDTFGAVRQAVSNNDLISMVELIVNSVGSVNVLEDPTISVLLSYLNSDYKDVECIITPEGLRTSFDKVKAEITAEQAAAAQPVELPLSYAGIEDEDEDEDEDENWD